MNPDRLLLFAATKMRLSDIQRALDNGADPNSQSPNGVTALHIAMDRNNIRAADMMVESGANLEITTMEGDTPLHYAARYGFLLGAKKLVQLGVNKSPKNSAGKTPFDVAVDNSMGTTWIYLGLIGAATVPWAEFTQMAAKEIGDKPWIAPLFEDIPKEIIAPAMVISEGKLADYINLERAAT